MYVSVKLLSLQVWRLIAGMQVLYLVFKKYLVEILYDVE